MRNPRMLLSVLLLAVAAVSSCGRSDAQLEKSQARVADLESQVAALKIQLAEEKPQPRPAQAVVPPSPTAPVVAPVPLVWLLDQLPDNLRPRDGDTPRTVDNRTDWLKQHSEVVNFQITVQLGSESTTLYEHEGLLGFMVGSPRWGRVVPADLIAMDPKEGLNAIQVMCFFDDAGLALLGKNRAYRYDVVTLSGRIVSSTISADDSLIAMGDCHVVDIKAYSR